MIDYESKAYILESIDLLRNRLDQIQSELPDVVDDYHKLFLYYVAERFEGLSPEKVKICDRKGDQKIDFFGSTEDRFVAYQCKLPELDILKQKEKVHTFDEVITKEADDILTFLTDEKGKLKGNKDSQEARNIYRSLKEDAQKDESICKAEAVLAFFGKMSPMAEDKLGVYKNKWEKGDGEYEINIIDFSRIAEELRLSLFAQARPKEIKLYYRPKTRVNTKEWAYTLVPAIHFYELFKKYKMSIFDLNVRYYLYRSPVNRQIISTLSTLKGQKNFHLLNNGITIACKGSNFARKEGENWGKFYHPQIVNGCQTVISIYKAYTQMADEYTRRHFKEHCYVPLRVISTQDPYLLDDVVLASNNQNKMSPRNLMSNSRIQRTLQNKFDQLDPRWFYERKDGEFESAKEYRSKGFKIENYKYSKSQFRKVSNEDIAKSWLSFIGFSKDASENIHAFEHEEDGGRYELLFEMQPNSDHWNKITIGPQVDFKKDNFFSCSPTAKQYMLSYLIYEYIKAYLPTPQSNKKECIDRLIKAGRIYENSSPEEINKALFEDDNYVLNQILYNMKEVIVELYSWILIKTYGPLDKEVTERILDLPSFSKLFEQPDFKLYIKELFEGDDKEKINNILFICFEFIKEAIQRWKSVHGKEYLTSQRRIRFLHSGKTIEQMKSFLNTTNEETKSFGYKWKPPYKEFLQSLPELKQPDY